MSHVTSPSTERRYGVVRVTHEWEMARSSFYDQLRRAAQPDLLPRDRPEGCMISDEGKGNRRCRRGA